MKALPVALAALALVLGATESFAQNRQGDSLFSSPHAPGPSGHWTRSSRDGARGSAMLIHPISFPWWVWTTSGKNRLHSPALPADYAALWKDGSVLLSISTFSVAFLLLSTPRRTPAIS